MEMGSMLYTKCTYGHGGADIHIGSPEDVYCFVNTDDKLLNISPTGAYLEFATSHILGCQMRVLFWCVCSVLLVLVERSRPCRSAVRTLPTLRGVNLSPDSEEI